MPVTMAWPARPSEVSHARTSEPAPTSSERGVASYHDICIGRMRISGDLDRGQISYQRFRVCPPYPHGFDGDADGRAGPDGRRASITAARESPKEVSQGWTRDGLTESRWWWEVPPGGGRRSGSWPGAWSPPWCRAAAVSRVASRRAPPRAWARITVAAMRSASLSTPLATAGRAMPRASLGMRAANAKPTIRRRRTSSATAQPRLRASDFAAARRTGTTRTAPAAPSRSRPRSTAARPRTRQGGAASRSVCR
jgi:hypothetical protein